LAPAADASSPSESPLVAPELFEPAVVFVVPAAVVLVAAVVVAVVEPVEEVAVALALPEEPLDAELLLVDADSGTRPS